MAGNTSQPSIKRVWGIAKSPELKLTDEELHLLVQAHTGKDSIKAVSYTHLTDEKVRPVYRPQT